jgi:hypothetical protein
MSAVDRSRINDFELSKMFLAGGLVGGGVNHRVVAHVLLSSQWLPNEKLFHYISCTASNFWLL